MVKDDVIKQYLQNARGIAWDECHKIYVLMDDRQMELMAKYGYDRLIKAQDTTPEEMFNTLIWWYEDSCGLRFIEAVRTNESNPNKGFTSLVGQGEEWGGNESDTVEGISWEELSQLTHETQVEKFGWCMCEDGNNSSYFDCPIKENN